MCRGSPNMNSLIGVGAMTSFGAGALAPLVPGLVLDASFMEEPVMLLAFVLLGRSLEARARLRASGMALVLLLPPQVALSLQRIKRMCCFTWKALTSFREVHLCSHPAGCQGYHAGHLLARRALMHISISVCQHKS